ncbi:MAG: TIR domain-containing protein [Bryobacteraceae bacterium]
MSPAERICSALESRGIACWMAPRDIPPGTDWPSAVMHGIKGSKVMVLILSAASHSDKQIAREVENADHEGLNIITFRLDNVSPPDELAYFLRNLQWLDAFNGRFDSAVEKLANVVLQPSTAAHTALHPRTPLQSPQAGLSNSKAPKDGSGRNRMTLVWGAIGIVAIAVIVWAVLHKSGPKAAPQNGAVVAAGQSGSAAPAAAGDAQKPNAPISLDGQSNTEVANSVPPASALNKTELVQLRMAARREWRSGKHEKAMTDISRLITLSPHWASPYLDRGEWELARGQNNEALADFKACIDAHPDSLSAEQIAYHHRGEIERTMGDSAAAHADLAQAASIKAKLATAKKGH